jgi:hypothetical protein
VLHVAPDAGPPVWYAESEAVAFAQAKRWTMFAEPLAVPATCFSADSRELTGQPLVVFADDHVLEEADRVRRCEHWRSDCFVWRRLKDAPKTIFAACGLATNIESLLDNWAAGLLRQFGDVYRSGDDRERLKRIADFALCATTSRTLRWDAYVCFALCQEPNRVQRTFDTFTHREFPEVSWDEFLARVRTRREILAAQGPVPQPPDATNKWSLNLGRRERIPVRGVPAL